MMSAYDREPSLQAQAVIGVMEDWFWAIENGTAQLRLPNPEGLQVSHEGVENIIRTIDEFFAEEFRRNPGWWARVGKETKGKPIDMLPEFNRLQGASREAFVQALLWAKQATRDGSEDEWL